MLQSSVACLQTNTVNQPFGTVNGVHARVVSQLVFIADAAGVYFSDSGSAPVPKFLNPVRIRVRLFFKFENPTPVQTPVTIIDPTVI